MIFKKLPEGFKPMTELEFARAYIQSHQEAGDSYSTLDVVRSWHNYQADPLGHFLSQPKLTVTDKESHDQQQRQENCQSDCKPDIGTHDWVS